MVKISPELKELAQIFKNNKKTLYIVGGFVRDSFLGIQSVLRDDIDLCSSVKPKELKKMLDGTDFSVDVINEKVGVMAIVGKRRYEHATFRKEIYESESHMPDRIEFINSLEEDARRRDFRINAIYYDILEETFIDPLDGISDLKEKILTTVKVPKIVFNDDPERILRFIRFACALGLKVPEEELFYAKQNAYKIQFISKNRLRAEFEKLLSADQIYPELLYTKDAHYRAMALIGEIGAWKYILPAMENMQKTSIIDKKGENIYIHILNSLVNASPKIRLAVLLHDTGKVKTMEEKKNFFGSKEFASSIIEKNLGVEGLGYTKNVVNRVVKTVIGYDFDPYCLASTKNVKRFIFRNKDVIENIIELKTVAKNETRHFGRRIKSAERLRKVYNQMLKEGAPFVLADLKIRGDDIIRANPKVNLEYLDEILDELLIKTALNPRLNKKQILLDVACKMINSNRDFYMDNVDNDNI